MNRQAAVVRPEITCPISHYGSSVRSFQDGDAEPSWTDFALCAHAANMSILLLPMRGPARPSSEDDWEDTDGSRSGEGRPAKSRKAEKGSKIEQGDEGKGRGGGSKNGSSCQRDPGS